MRRMGPRFRETTLFFFFFPSLPLLIAALLEFLWIRDKKGVVHEKIPCVWRFRACSYSLFPLFYLFFLISPLFLRGGWRGRSFSFFPFPSFLLGLSSLISTRGTKHGAEGCRCPQRLPPSSSLPFFLFPLFFFFSLFPVSAGPGFRVRRRDRRLCRAGGDDGRPF